ncbi:MAG: transposase, partial [Acidimicrobiales bacterium]
MAYTYRAPQRDQAFLLPPTIGDWLPESHLVWFVLDVVAMVDLSGFHARHPNDGVGRRAYDPEMMLALLFYAYSVGLRSSRRIEAGVRSDLAFKAICCDIVPDHIAIARFRTEHERAITDAFVDVLRLCARAGLASLGTVAIDGTKIGSDAALDANRTESAIRAEVERILAEARASDDDDATQVSLSGELPEVLAHRSSRLGRLRAALGEIETERRAAREKEETQTAHLDEEAQEGLRPRGRSPKDPARRLARAQADLGAATVRRDQARSPLAKLDATEMVVQAKRELAAARGATEAAPGPPEPRANTTDPESKIMKTTSGWVQGFNAQAAVNENQVIVAAAVTTEPNDVHQLLPLIAGVEANAAAAGLKTTIGTVLADAGYWSETNATSPGPDRLTATTK